MKSINTLQDLKNYTKSINKEILIEKVYHIDDSIEIRFNNKKEEDFEPMYVLYGLLVGKNFTYLWFRDYETKNITDENTIYFNHFYNQANGAKQKGLRRYLNWERRQKDF